MLKRALRELAGSTGLELKKIAGEEPVADAADPAPEESAEPEEEYVD